MKIESKKGWSYQHSFGIIYNGTLVVTDRKYFNGESWGYNYFKLGVEMNEDEGKKLAKELNIEFGLDNKDKFFNSKDSQNLLLRIQDKFVNAEIRK